MKRKHKTTGAVLAHLQAIGRKGGQMSRRTLTPEQARAMVAARELKRQAKAKKPTPAARQRPNNQ